TSVSEADELRIGTENYAPMRQMQGGDLNIDPELTRYVNEVGQRLAKVSDRPGLPYEFVVINGSVPNAWALPGGKIAVNRGLLTELENEAELAAVLGHEITHAAARHSAKAIDRAQRASIGVGIAAVILGVSNKKYGGALLGASMIGVGLITQKHGRDAELEADRYGMEYMRRAGYDLNAAVTLQEKFVKLSEGKSSGWLAGLFASHPPSQERVDRNRAKAIALGGGGQLGVESYMQHMKVLNDSTEAYQAYDEGITALRENETDTAFEKADTAISIQPREAKFYYLKAEALMTDKKRKQALVQLNEAITRNPDYFEFLLARGLLFKDMKNLNSARQDLQKSIQLFPTALAHEGLGDINRIQGNREPAMENYAVAAQSDSETGRRAARKLQSMRNKGR
ncbi:MAG: M48 family metalloprotease, partial [Gammaproteobacteria bacterium]